MNTNKENEWREEFEKIKSSYYSCDKTKNHFGQYQSIEARCAWEAYLQACRARQSEIDALEKRLDFFAYDEKIQSLKAELEKARELIREEIKYRGIKFPDREKIWEERAKEFLKKEG